MRVGRMIQGILLLVGCGALVSGCASGRATEMNEQEKVAVAAAVEQRVAGYREAFLRLDLEYVLGFWADAEGFVVAGDGALTIGYDAWAAHLRESAANMAAVHHVEFKNPQIYVLASDAASYSTEFEWSVTTVTAEKVSCKGAWTYVFKRLDGEWKVVHSAGTHLYEKAEHAEAAEGR